MSLFMFFFLEQLYIFENSLNYSNFYFFFNNTNLLLILLFFLFVSHNSNSSSNSSSVSQSNSIDDDQTNNKNKDKDVSFYIRYKWYIVSFFVVVVIGGVIYYLYDYQPVEFSPPPPPPPSLDETSSRVSLFIENKDQPVDVINVLKSNLDVCYVSIIDPYKSLVNSPTPPSAHDIEQLFFKAGVDLREEFKNSSNIYPIFKKVSVYIVSEICEASGIPMDRDGREIRNQVLTKSYTLEVESIVKSLLAYYREMVTPISAKDEINKLLEDLNLNKK